MWYNLQHIYWSCRVGPLRPFKSILKCSNKLSHDHYPISWRRDNASYGDIRDWNILSRYIWFLRKTCVPLLAVFKPRTGKVLHPLNNSYSALYIKSFSCGRGLKMLSTRFGSSREFHIPDRNTCRLKNIKFWSRWIYFEPFVRDERGRDKSLVKMHHSARALRVGTNFE